MGATLRPVLPILFAATLTLVACGGIPPDAAEEIDDVVKSARELCGYIPTAKTVAAVVASLNPGSGVAAVPAVQAAEEICDSLPDGTQTRSRPGTLVAGETDFGLRTEAFFVGGASNGQPPAAR